MKVKQAFQVSNLLFSWKKNDRVTLDIPSLMVKQGESIFIQGISGSGKSTLLNILSGVLTVQHGDITILDKPFSSLSHQSRDKIRANHIGYIFQQFNLLPYLSVIENVLLPLNISTARRQGRPRHSPSLIEEAKHFLTKLQIPVNIFHEKVSQLSVGQQQRVAAARAMIGSPEIIIADEPTSALDKNNSENFMDVLVSQCKKINSSLVFVSHDVHLCQYLDNNYTLDQSPGGVNK